MEAILEQVYRGENLKTSAFPRVGTTQSSLLVPDVQRRKPLALANNPLSLCVSPPPHAPPLSLAPYFCPVNASFAFEAAVSPLLDTPREARSLGPACGMLYSARPMEEGHPGTQERARALRSAHACTRTCTRTGRRRHARKTQVRTHRQIQLLRAITTLWPSSKSKTSESYWKACV